MRISLFLQFLVVANLSFSKVSSDVSVGISKEQIDKAIDFISNLIGKDLRPLLTLPDVKVKKGKVTNIKITHIDLPVIKIKQTTTEIHVLVTKLGVKLSANWEAKPILRTRKGTLTAYAEDIEITLILRKSNFRVKKCTDKIGSLSFKFYGKKWLDKILAWLANIFRKRISKKVKPSLKGKICNGLTKILNDNSKHLDKILKQLALGKA